jgi:hypothetical protein
VTRRTKSALLWGVTGALSFLVLVQGVALFAEPLLSIVEAVTVALAVAVVVAVGAYALEPAVAEWTRNRGRE